MVKNRSDEVQSEVKHIEKLCTISDGTGLLKYLPDISKNKKLNYKKIIKIIN